MSHAAVKSGTSRNPFLSPTHTGSSQVSPYQQALPNLHTAFEGLDVSSDNHPSVTDSNITTSPQSSSRNPFLEPNHTGASRLSAREVEELEDLSPPSPWPRKEEGTDEPVVSRGGASSPWGVHDDGTVAAATSSSSKATSSWPASSSAGEGSVSGSGGGPAIDHAARQAEQFADDDAAVRAAIAASLGDSSADAATSSSSANTFQPPAGSPPALPNRRPTNIASQSIQQQDEREEELPGPPSDPPPAYTAAEGITVEIGPSRPTWTQPAPIELQHTGWSVGGGNPGGFITPQSTGYTPHPSTTPTHRRAVHSVPPPPPRINSDISSPYHTQPSTPNSSRPSPPQPPMSPHQQHSPQPPLDPSPSDVPIIGRPYLNQGRVLIYTGGFVCGKCGNSGYKFNDPTHPCKTCWKKFGRPYSSAIQHSWSPPAPGYQRPLSAPRPSLQTFTNGPTFPGYNAHAGGQYRQVVPRPPPGALVLQPGDPRIGGVLCQRCFGRGLIPGFFEDDMCGACRGMGRIF